MDQNPLFVTII